MSRPWSSVPKTKFELPPSIQAGGSRASDRFSVARSKGLCGETHGAKTEQNTHSAAITAASTAIGEVRKLNQMSLSSQRAMKPREWVVVIRSMSAGGFFQAQPRIDGEVQQVDGQVYDDE